MSQHSSLVAALETISSKITKRITYPNHGGCGVIASIVGKHLARFTDVKVLVQDRNKLALVNARNNNPSGEFNDLSDWYEQGVSFYHVLLKVKLNGKWRVFDSTGIIPFYARREDKGLKYCKDHITMDELHRVAADAGGWNWMFDREQIPKIERIVDRAFRPLYSEV